MTTTYLPGTASLVEEIDKKLMVLLRDGRTLIGILRSIDQFANLLLQKTTERIYVGNKYGDIPRGIFFIRGENVVLLGEVDEEKEKNKPLDKVSIDEILELQQLEQGKKDSAHQQRKQAMSSRGLFPVISDPLQEEYL